MTALLDIPADAAVVAPGVYDIPEALYHSDPVPGGSLSSTGARKLLPPSCPAKYRYEADHPRHKAEFDFGSAAHMLVLGTGPEIRVVDADDWRTKAAKEAAAEARAEGLIPLLAADCARVHEMALALRMHPVASVLFDSARGGLAEQSLFWQDAEFGVWCRARLDWLPPLGGPGRLVVADYKTTISAEPGHIAKSVANYGYHQQDAFYLAGVRALGLDEDPAFVFVFQEKEPPYLVTVVELDAAARQAGHDRNRLALEMYRDCKQAGIWPGYSQDIELISLPAWARGRISDGGI